MNGLGKEKSNKKSKKKNQIIMKRDSLLEVTLNVFSEEEFDVCSSPSLPLFLLFF